MSSTKIFGRLFTASLFFILMLIAPLQGQSDSISDDELDFQEYLDDTLSISVREFDQTSLARYRSMSEFDYSKEVPESSSFFQKVIRWLVDQFFGVFSDGDIKSYIFFGIICIVVAFLLSRSQVRGLFRRAEVPLPGVGFEEIENIEAVDLAELMRKAEAGFNYRLALRYRYLTTLKRLSEIGEIEWRKDKSNSDYVKELNSARGRRLRFSFLTRLYEYVWYGGFQVSATEYKKHLSEYERFDRGGDE